MGLLDKLKPQPRWKHADPAVRLEAVRELDDAAELAVLAESDFDARVRRAAICRISDPSVLGRVAAGDADPETRDRAADRLLALATTGPDEASCLAAVRALADPRRLSTIARSEAADAVRAEALARTTDERSLSGVARHARNEATAIAALGRLTDSAELVEVAQNSEHRDVALAAFERVIAGGVDLALVRTIESRGQQKAVSRRARAVIQDIEAAEQSRRAAEEDRRRREVGFCDAVERVADISDLAAARAELARLTESWAAFGATDATILARFAQGAAAAESTIARRQLDLDEAAQQARQRAEAIATRDALCARVETLDGDDVLAQLRPIEEDWQSLTPLIGNGPEADRLAERFARAVAACRKRHELGTLLAETRTKFEALVAEAEGLTSQEDAAASARWPSLSREARGHASMLGEASRPAEDLAARLKAVEDTLAAREAARESARRDAVAQAQQSLLGQLTRLAERARRASEADAITLREGDRLLRDISTALDILPKADVTREIDDAAGKLRELQAQVAPRVRELREMDEWRRFANAQRQEQLIAMAEAIVASLKSEAEAGKESDLAATARALRELHAKWHEVAEAPRHSAQRLWDRFRGATDFIRSRCESYFAQLRADRESSVQKRVAVVEEAEALASSGDWGKATARFQALQMEWQQLGPGPRDAQRDLSHRFRVACNAFFARRREDLTSRKKTWSENLSRKEALCERAETLAASTEWESASSEMKRLQSEWKSIGPVRRSKSEVVWARFRAAADRFFERYHNRHQIALAGKLAEREALVVELEQLASAEEPVADLSDRVQSLRTTWNRSVPIPGVEIKPLADRWQAALARVVERQGDAFKGTELDPAAVRQRMEKLIARIETFLADVKEPSASQSQTELLAARLRSALASNAMGGRVNEDSKWRSAADAVKEAQTAWQRLGPLVTPEARALDTRFRDVCRRVMDQARRHAPPPPGRRPSRPSTPEHVGV